jgi:hypothetical protein
MHNDHHVIDPNLPGPSAGEGVTSNNKNRITSASKGA